MFKFSEKSLLRMQGVDERLIAVAKRAIQLSGVDFMVVEGVRTLDRQKVLMAEGKSKTLNSKHLTGHAIDVAAFRGSKITWDKQPYVDISKAFKTASNELTIPIRWGGEFKSFFDGPHYELLLP